MGTLIQDVRYAFRMLRKSPGFATVAVLTLALGIGANTAIFSLINAVMLRNLPVKNPQQLVLFQWEAAKWPPHFSMTGWQASYAFSYEEFKEFSEQNKVMSSVFAFVPLGFNDQDTTVGINGEPTLADGMMVTGQYFSGLGVTPLLGRGLTDADENPGAPRAAVISYAYWTRRFAQDSAIIGKNVTLNGIPFTIVGVTPASFYGVVGSEPDLWVPFDDKANMRPFGASPGGTNSVFTARDWMCLNIMGRLKDGVTKEQAQSALDAVFRQFVTSEWRPAKESDIPHFLLSSGRQGLPVVQQYFQQPLSLLMVAVGLLLLIACANVATLLLARASSRQKEISVRLAVGASRSRLIRQLLTESVLMSALGGLLGLAFANWGTHALIALLFSGPNGTATLDVGADSRVLLFAFAVALLTGIVFGLAPALGASKADLLSAMKDSSAASDPRSKHRLGESLIVAQVAASLVLMVGAGLFVRTLANFETHNFGFDQRNLLTFELDPTRAGYHDARLVNLYSQLLDRIQALPGVRAASMLQNAPFSGWSGKTHSVNVEGSPQKQSDSAMYFQGVGPDFFSTMGIPVVLGRGIQRTDTVASSKVAVIDETFAKKYFRGANPIGHRFSFGSPKFDPANSYEIVGIVRPAELTNVSPGDHAKAYTSYAQFPKTLGQMYFEVRAQGSPATIISELRDAVHQTDASLPLIALKTQTEETSEALSLQRLFAQLTTAFGLLALLLAMIGLYGTMAYSVTRKTHEIGIRMALGANPANVLSMVLRQGIVLTLVGVVLGTVAALGATRLIASLIFGVSPYDALTFIAVAAILLIVALAACYIPARRAMQVDPMVALRYE